MTEIHENLSVPDFRPQIRQAIESAPLHTFSAPDQGNSDQQVAHNSYADLPDEEAFYSKHADRDLGYVYATDPRQYVDLLEQAYNILHPSAPIDAVQEEAKRVAEHEGQHAQKAAEINPDASIRFNVAFIKADINGEIKVGISPSVSLEGEFRKIDLAAIAAAPRDSLSPSDIAQLKSYGFESVEELDQRRSTLEERRSTKRSVI